MFRSLAPAALPILILAAVPAGAQSGNWPALDDLYVNDHATIIDAATEDRLRATLAALKDETGVEMTVLTIPRRADYGAWNNIESFATALFNAWGVGDADRDDGILVLVAHRDREMRLELGAGYPAEWDRVARAVVDDSFLPDFGADRYAQGIETGTAATIARIARPHAAGTAPGTSGGGGGAGLLPPLLFAAFVAAAVFRRRLSSLRDRLRRCPDCGHRGLRVTREEVRPATAAEPGEGRAVTSCPACGHRDEKPYAINRSSGSQGRFGGGRSSGGGASGRW
ncbi:TPM domain-containing protein [Rhodovulum euryhalinum]|uniref:TPM domain-containing protein n=1 Tax=Rhodovulum euryhalinum TaxID=35805 RepID=A0A4V2SAN8_9RHOB|nr:TPM domain-containing protein [Rhodovulum euryhalinum]TCO72430.1 uncharacterized protein EV655_104117 [Rhodovulum euryhalinum]